MNRLRRRIDPAAAGASSSAGSGATSSASSAPRVAQASAATATPTPASPARSRTLVAAAVAIVVLGLAAFALSRSAGLWGTGESAADAATAADRFHNMTIDRVGGLGQISGPTLSRDGKLLAYVRRDGPENSIWLRQMATGSVVQVVGPTPNTLASVQFTPDGNFLYFAENTTTRPISYVVKRVPAFGGAPQEVARGRIDTLSFAPDGKRFVVSRDAPSAWEIVVVNADGSGESVIASTPKGPSTSFTISPSWSPSGAYLATAVVRTDGKFRTDLQIMRPDGSDARTLALSATRVPVLRELVWGPSDDVLLAVAAYQPGPFQVFAIRVSSGGLEPITNDTNSYSGLSFSPGSGTIAAVQDSRLGSIWIGPVDRPEDAVEVSGRVSELDGGAGITWLNDREIVFTRGGDGPSVWISNTDGSSARRLIDGMIVLGPNASRDGRVVVFHGGHQATTPPQIFTLSVADGRTTQVTRESGALDGVLSPDGRTVFFQRYPPTPARLLSVPVDGGTAVPLFEASSIFGYAPSPDGTELAVVSTPGVGLPRTVSLMPVGGGTPRTIFTTGATLFGVKWYPSGNAQLLLMDQNRQTNLFRLDLAGGEPRQITHFTRGNIANPAFSPDGRRLAYYRGASESNIVLLTPKTK
jgi:Tol biopolymer transport system component